MIYFDNAATSFPKPKEVSEAVCFAINNFGNPSRGAHKTSLDASRAVYDARERISQLFNVKNPVNVVFTSNATESLNTVINGLFNTGDHVITTEMEHNSVLRPLYVKEREEVELSILKCDKLGNIDYSKIEAEIKSNTKAVICTHGSNLTGNLIEIKIIGEICRKHKILFILDASQTAGFIDIDMQEQNIDILCFTGHKSLYGPQGTGGICIKNSIYIEPLKVGGSGNHSYSKTHPQSMPDALEAGTMNSHGLYGLAAGVKFIQGTGMDKIREHELKLMWRFYNEIKNISDIKIYGDFSTSLRAPIVSLNIKDYDSGEISDYLAENYNIATRPGAHCAPLMHEALGTVEQGAVRFSFSYFNTEEEIDTAIRAVREIAAE